jgi:ubiquinone/menaquinone biosynthesis C-methylase UbiE
MMKDNITRESEQTWDAIAESFDITRKKPWQQCIDFINELPKSVIVADLGCGNGRHLLPCADRCKQVIGIDISRRLLHITWLKVVERGFFNVSLLHSDLSSIPMMKNTLDAVLYIASLHNIQGRARRIQSLKEVNRILNIGGIGLISVWSRWQDHYRQFFLDQQKIGLDGREFGDIEIPWKQDGLDVPRFYHLYDKQEFQEDLQAAGLFIERIDEVRLRSNMYPDNFFVIVQKM